MKKILISAVILAGTILASLSYARVGNQAPVALTGVVTSDAEGPMEGVLVTAKLDGGTIATTVVSDAKGRYSFPGDRLQSGKYHIAIRAVGYEMKDPGMAEVMDKKATNLNLKLDVTKKLASQLMSTEWLQSVPGTTKQKEQLYQCTSCHSATPILTSKYTADEFKEIFPRMRNHMENNSYLGLHSEHPDPTHVVQPGDDAYAQYLASINLSTSTNGKWSYELKKDARPTGRATRVIMTEYDLPSLANPHDALFDKASGMVWFSEFTRNLMGRLDPRTGEVKEWVVPTIREGAPEGSLKLALDKEGNPWLGMWYQGGLGRFDKKTEKFTTYTLPSEQLSHQNERTGDLAVSPDGTVWTKTSQTSKMYRLDPETNKWTSMPMVPGMGWYGMEADAEGNIYSCSLGKGAVGEINVHGEKVEMVVYPTPTPNSGSRRGHMDKQGRLWFGEYNSGGIGMFDPKTKKIQEWAPPTPFAGSYDANISDNGEGWSAGLASDYLFRLDPSTGKYVEYLLPTLDENIRRVDIDNAKTPVTIWIGEVHRAKILKVEPLD